MIQVSSHSEPGGHAENEDAYEVQAHRSDPDSYLFAIADGQGGQFGGAPAARLACKICLESAAAFAIKQLLLPSNWMSILGNADRAVAADAESGFTTLVGFCISNNWICGASSGDSAVYCWDQVNQGETLTARQFKNPPVGSGGANIVPFAASLPISWRVAAMTDGVWRFIGWKQLRLTFKQEPSERVIEILLESARSTRTGLLQDDFTILIARGE